MSRKIEGWISESTDMRVKRIKELHSRDLTDEEVLTNAINCYWLALESREARKTLT